MSFLTSLIPSAGSMASFVKTVMWGTILLTIFTTLAVIIRNKVKYQYYGFVFRRRQEDFQTGLPTSVRLNGKAGYFSKKGKVVFRIKYGIMWWQQVQLTKLPDPQYMIGNTVFYIQLNKDNYAQAKLNVDWTKKGLSLEPVEDDLKYGAKLDIAEKDSILKTQSRLQQAAPFIILGIILMAGMIILYFIQRGCSA